MGNKKEEENKIFYSIKRRGFTLIELMIIIAIIGILAVAIMVSTGQSKKNARINNAKTALKGAVLVVVSCNDKGSAINIPLGAETGTKLVCGSAASTYWPKLQGGYTYVAGGNYTANCNFQINTNGDSTSNITCTCDPQKCN